MDILLAISAFLLAIVGLVGSVVPVLPGPPVGWLGMLLLSFTPWWTRPGWFLLVWLAVVIAVTVADNVLPVVMTRKFGGSRAATWGTILGMIAGLFFAPWGMVLGPFIGAYVGEIVGNRSEGRIALRVATGAFVAFIGGVGIKLVASGMMVWYMVSELIT